MIHSTDRSGYFGGSDTKDIMGTWNTNRWDENFWKVKTGENLPKFGGNIYTRMGNIHEHPILLSIDPDMKLDGQIIYDKYLLRVNYDGFKDGIIYECKTHYNNPRKEFAPYEVSTEHWMQSQVEMYVYRKMSKKWFLPDFKELYIVSYECFEDDKFIPFSDDVVIDESRRRLHKIKYDDHWIRGEYLPRLKILARSLKKGKYPIWQ